MRIIAAVTLIFLPGTFTATLFSTSFFSFQTPDKPRVVSHWIWLYATVTVGLTMLVIGAWVVWSHFEHSTSEKDLGIANDSSRSSALSH
jgi:heme/copper-type cytochrome/quinol oxidase subunit 2